VLGDEDDGPAEVRVEQARRSDQELALERVHPLILAAVLAETGLNRELVGKRLSSWLSFLGSFAGILLAPRRDVVLRPLRKTA
jgi:hypothetical protein